MSDAAISMTEDSDADGSLPVVEIETPGTSLDLATVLGLTFAFLFIIGAIILGQSNANFFNVPSLMIVLFGTMAATAISYTPTELKRTGSVIAKSILRRTQNPSKMARSLMDLAVIAKKKGVLTLSTYEHELAKDDFLHNGMQMAIDGFNADEIERLMRQEVEALAERHKRSASITRRASEVAPAMGLIGTLVGLVQMLADLENPDTIGPAMAVALLTTFYGAILGTIVMAPLAVKLEKNSTDETLIKTLIVSAVASVARQDNPRRLEMQMNSDLPPSDRIHYFD